MGSREQDLCANCYEDLVLHDSRNLRCPNRRSIYKSLPESVYWNPYNKVVQDHRDGTIYENATNAVREKLRLKVPWNSRIGRREVKEKAVHLVEKVQ
jgi:hypothetical protein